MPLAPFATRLRPGQASRRGRLAVLLAVLGIVAALLAYAISPSVRHAVKRAAHSVGHAVTHVFKGNDRPAAPALPAEVLVGPAVTLHALHGHPAVVAFWTARCAGCSREARAIEEFSLSAAGRGRVVGVNVGDPKRLALAFVRHHRWTFSNLRDGSGAVSRRYGIKLAPGLPMTYVLDGGGKIAATIKGPVTAQRLAGALKTARTK